MIRGLIASPMKCASTFVSRVLAYYYSIPHYKPFRLWGWQDHVLTPELLTRAPQSFILQSHLKASRPTVGSIKQLDIPVICLWRNLGDVIISLADHVRNEWHEIPVCYIRDRQAFCDMATAEQYDYLIGNALPWYLGFRRGWAMHMGHEGCFHTYEDLIADNKTFFANLIQVISPLDEVDQCRLSKAISLAEGPGTRKNQGVSDRALKLLSQSQKESIEELIRKLGGKDEQYLLAELPWMGHRNK